MYKPRIVWGVKGVFPLDFKGKVMFELVGRYQGSRPHGAPEVL